MDSYCYKGYCLSYNTFAKMQTQSLTIKKFKPKKSKFKKSKPPIETFSAPLYINEFIKSLCQDKKKNYCKKTKSEKLYLGNRR